VQELEEKLEVNEQLHKKELDEMSELCMQEITSYEAKIEELS
jgi:hypothetical protein